MSQSEHFISSNMAEASNLVNFLKWVAANNMLLFHQLYRLNVQFWAKPRRENCPLYTFLSSARSVSGWIGPTLGSENKLYYSALLSRPAGMKLEGVCSDLDLKRTASSPKTLRERERLDQDDLFTMLPNSQVHPSIHLPAWVAFKSHFHL